jgi:hypothetical protein
MATRQPVAEEWLERNHKEMFYCPYQPGNLMISKNACSKRYGIAREESYQDLLKGDFFHYSYKRGLSRCRDCPIGKKLSLSPGANKSPDRLRARDGRPNRPWKIPLQKSA